MAKISKVYAGSTAALVKELNAKGYGKVSVAPAKDGKNTVVTVDPYFGTGEKAEAILNAYKPVADLGAASETSSLTSSEWLGLPTLTKPGTFFSGNPLLIKGAKFFSGTPLLLAADKFFSGKPLLLAANKFFSGTPLLLASDKFFSGTPLLTKGKFFLFTR